MTDHINIDVLALFTRGKYLYSQGSFSFVFSWGYYCLIPVSFY